MERISGGPGSAPLGVSEAIPDTTADSQPGKVEPVDLHIGFLLPERKYEAITYKASERDLGRNIRSDLNGSCPVKCVNGGSLREQARLRAQASRTRAASVSDRVTASLAIDCMLRYRRCTRHSSSCSCRTAPISRRAAAALGKMPTTST